MTELDINIVHRILVHCPELCLSTASVLGDMWQRQLITYHFLLLVLIVQTFKSFQPCELDVCHILDVKKLIVIGVQIVVT